MNALAAPLAIRGFSPSRLAVGGVAGLVVWEIFARAVAPLWIGEALDPTGLVEAALGIGGVGAFVVHLLTGLVAYPLVWMLAVAPAAAALALPWWLAAAGYGVALWVFALGIIAGLVAGFPPFLGFAALAWASLVGHVLMTLATAAAIRAHA